MKQFLTDIHLLLTTDKRIWAGAAFFACSIFIWLFTGSWRHQTQEPKTEKIYYMPEEKEVDRALVKEMHSKIKEGAEERQYLKDTISRVQQQIAADTEEIDWKVNSLVTRLNTVSNKVDNLANDIGQTAIQNSELEKKIRKGKSKLVFEKAKEEEE